jgi:uncharacterized protein (DUF1778 family)
VFSLKIGAEELDELYDAAEAQGLEVGTFIREAALEKARRMAGKADAIEAVRQQARALAEAVEKL